MVSAGDKATAWVSSPLWALVGALLAAQVSQEEEEGLAVAAAAAAPPPRVNARETGQRKRAGLAKDRI